MKTAVVLLAAAIVLVSCSTSPTQPEPDQLVTLPYGGTVKVGASQVPLTFTDINDSRCPRSVTCVWAGDAAVRLESNGESVVLHTNGGTAGSSSAQLRGLTLTLTDVKPERETTDAPDKSAYRATVRVTQSR